MTPRRKFYDVHGDYDQNEYRVVERHTEKIVARFRYLAGSERARGIAHGRANVHRLQLNRNNQGDR